MKSLLITEFFDLISEFKKIPKSDYMALVKIYEANLDVINQIAAADNPRYRDIIMQLKGDYGISLVHAGYYSKALNPLEESIVLFEKSPSLNEADLYSDTFTQQILWSYGVALWETRKLSEAKAHFERLVLLFPENEKYRMWLNGLKVEKARKISQPLWVICLVWLVAEFTIFEKLNPRAQLILSIVGLLFLSFVVSIELYVYKKNLNRSSK